jgi:hypothetical protein
MITVRWHCPGLSARVRRIGYRDRLPATAQGTRAWLFQDWEE